MKKMVLAVGVLICSSVSLFFTSSARAEEPTDYQPDTSYIGIVREIGEVLQEDSLFLDETLRRVLVELNSRGSDVWTVEAQYSEDLSSERDDLRVGERVVVMESHAFPGETRYIITDKYRLPSMAMLLGIFLLSAIVFAGRKGFSAIVGLAVSLLILTFYTVPSIMSGGSPFLVATISAIVIAILSLSIAHGFSRQTGIALASTLVTLVISLGLSEFFVSMAKLFGGGTEEAYFLAFSGLGAIDLRGLLLAGIIIGVLGVLDDVTTTQTAAVSGFAREGVRGLRALYASASSIGREHIVSLVNTLALAYVGASLPLLLLFSVNEGQVPLWLLLNGQIVTEEIIRTLVGSTALILAVPLSTIVAAWFYTRFSSLAREDDRL